MASSVQISESVVAFPLTDWSTSIFCSEFALFFKYTWKSKKNVKCYKFAPKEFSTLEKILA